MTDRRKFSISFPSTVLSRVSLCYIQSHKLGYLCVLVCRQFTGILQYIIGIMFSFFFKKKRRKCSVKNIIFPLWARRQSVDTSFRRVFIIFSYGRWLLGLSNVLFVLFVPLFQIVYKDLLVLLEKFYDLLVKQMEWCDLEQGWRMDTLGYSRICTKDWKGILYRKYNGRSCSVQ